MKKVQNPYTVERFWSEADGSNYEVKPPIEVFYSSTRKGVADLLGFVVVPLGEHPCFEDPGLIEERRLATARIQSILEENGGLISSILKDDKFRGHTILPAAEPQNGRHANLRLVSVAA